MNDLTEHQSILKCQQTAAGKHALFAMQYWCPDLGIDDIGLSCSLFSPLVQPVLSMGVKYGV